MNIYSSDEYRVIINELMAEKKFLDKTYSFQAMAEFIRVQKPYLSKVMNSRADLSSDQLYMCCQYLELNEEETNYLLLLLEHERCSYSERKKTLAKKIDQIQNSKRDSKNILSKTINSGPLEFNDSIHMEYYLNPIIQIVHIFLTIPRFRKKIDQIAEELLLTKEHLNEILKKLVAMQLIEINGGNINVLVKSLHLPRESNIVPAHQQIMKQYGIYRMNRLTPEQKKSFSVTFSSNEACRKKIELEFNQFLAKVRELSMEGDKKDCYQLNFDLFPWSIPN